MTIPAAAIMGRFMGPSNLDGMGVLGERVYGAHGPANPGMGRTDQCTN